ncbi:MAG: hypothetical protein PHF44_04200 [Candidatus Pacebacteria bacterium]|nr:hypothetical protein [Candidatus Paceibacterota bacterium]
MNFDILDILFLPLLFFIGAITSYQDFKYGKIKNKWIILGLSYGLGAYLIFTVLNLTGYGSFFSSVLANSLFKNNWTNLIGNILLNSFCSFFLTFVLWRFNLWSAGDAKLFFVFSWILPLKYYFNSFIQVFPAINLFINTFIVAFLFLFTVIAIHFLKEFFPTLRVAGLKNLFKKIFIESRVHLKSVLDVALILISIFLTIKIIIEKLQISSPFNLKFLTILTIIGLVVFRNQMSIVLKKYHRIIYIYFFLVIIYLIIFSNQQLGEILTFVLKTIFIFSLMFGAIILMPQFYLQKNQKVDMPFAVWLTLGAIITIILRGSVLRLLSGN